MDKKDSKLSDPTLLFGNKIFYLRAVMKLIYISNKVAKTFFLLYAQ